MSNFINLAMQNSQTEQYRKRCKKADIDGLQDTFKLSDGEKQFLVSAKRGEILIKAAGQSVVAEVVALPLEERIITPENFKDEE